MRRFEGITQSTLTKQLRELENDGFLHREIYKEILPKVEYSLTEFGESFIPVLQTMMTWSEKYLCPDYVNPYNEITSDIQYNGDPVFPKNRDEWKPDWKRSKK